MLARKSGNIVLMISGGLFVLTGAGIALNQYVSGTAQKRLRNVAHLDRNFYAGEMAAVQQFIYARQNPTANDTSTGGETLSMTLSQFNGNASTNPNTQNVDRSVTSSRDTAPGFFVQGYTGSNLKARRKGMGTAARVFCGQLEGGSSGAMGQVCLGEIVVPTGAYKVTPCYHWGEEDPDFIANAIDINNEADLRSRFASNSPPAAYYRLTTDITLTSPITELNLNNSVFDGGGHTITGLETAQNYGQPWVHHRGLFASVSMSKIKNLNLRDVRVVANTLAAVGNYQQRGGFGALAGTADYSCFDNISVIGGVIGGKDFTLPEVVSSAGGLIGQFTRTSSRGIEITNSFTAVRVNSRMWAGGLVGRGSEIKIGGSSSLSYVKGGQVAAGLIYSFNQNFNSEIVQSSFGGTLEDSGIDSYLHSYMPPPFPTVASMGVEWGRLEQVESRPKVILHNGYYQGLQAGRVLYSLEAGEIERFGDEPGWKVATPIMTHLCWAAYPESFAALQSLSILTGFSSSPETLATSGTSTHNCGTLSQVYWDQDRDSISGVREGVGKTTAELKSASLYSSWDSTKWKIENGQYPKPKKVPPLPAVRANCTLQATPATINVGDSVELRINGLGTATYALINEERVPVSDARLTVNPQFTRTYEAWAMGPDGVARCRADVRVANRPRVVIAGLNTHDPTNTSGNIVANRYILVRYHYDGSLDTYFGSNGWIASMIENRQSHSDSRSGDFLMEPNGRFITITGAVTTAGAAVMLSRFNPDGALDPSFGTLGKKAVLFPLGAWMSGNAQVRFNRAALQSDGKIVLFGLVGKPSTGNYDVFFLRLNADGSLDTSHGFTAAPTGSVSPYPIPAQPRDVKVLPDNSALLLLSATDGASTMPLCPASPAAPQIAAVVKVRPNGTLDPAFGTGGISRFCLSALGSSHPTQIMPLPGGKILIAGASFHPTDNGTSHPLVLTRLNSDGSVDTSYAGMGFKILYQRGWLVPTDYPRSVFAEGAPGKFLLIGERIDATTGQSCLFEIDSDGVWNESFGTAGKSCIAVAMGGHSMIAPPLPEPAALPNGPILVFPGIFGGGTLTALERDADLDTAFGQTLLDPFFPYNSATIQQFFEFTADSPSSSTGVRMLYLHAKNSSLTSFFPSIIGGGIQN